MKSELFDFIIAGSGFAGSIAAIVLAKNGFDVCLIEKNTHPRFTIGESSTPIADMILRSLAERHDLPFLHELSRYGSWQKNHPELLCGIKRGFSYYFHSRDKLFEKSLLDSKDLLVAASNSNRDSDTNWYRPDIDHFLVLKAKEYGVHYMDNTQILETEHADRSDVIHCELNTDSGTNRFRSRWFIDATGSALFAEKHFGVTSESSGFKSHSFAVYSHFQGTKRWSDYLTDQNLYKKIYPYNPDYSALHHIIDEGWVWNLRFRNDLLSAGIVFDLKGKNELNVAKSNKILWDETISKYPSISYQFNHAALANFPGTFYRSGRLQRRMDKIFGKNWVALNHSAGFVDPLHSTGIAHSLSGLERLLRIFLEDYASPESLLPRLNAHQKLLLKEIEIIDLLVSGCYLTRRHCDLFHAYTMVYFACAIAYEQKRLQEIIPDSYLCANDPNVNQMVQICYTRLNSILERKNHEPGTYIDFVREKIKPWNIAGLLDPDKEGVYEHTAVELGG